MIQHIAALQQSPRVHVKNERKARKILQDGSSPCRCLTTSHGNPKTMKKNANQALSSFFCKRRDSHQEGGHSSDLDQKRNGILLMIANHKENGTESQN